MPLDDAFGDVASRLDAIATTEVSVAYNDEHRRQTELEAHALPFMLKTWDADLDKRTCLVCEYMHGDTVHWGQSFKNGRMPGAVHPRCRCQEHSVFVPVIYQTEEAT